VCWRPPPFVMLTGVLVLYSTALSLVCNVWLYRAEASRPLARMVEMPQSRGCSPHLVRLYALLSTNPTRALLLPGHWRAARRPLAWPAPQPLPVLRLLARCSPARCPRPRAHALAHRHRSGLRWPAGCLQRPAWNTRLQPTPSHGLPGGGQCWPWTTWTPSGRCM